MKKNPTALLLDSETELARKMGEALEGLFSKVIMENNHDKYETTYEYFKPEVVFVNLNISQRDANLSFVERIVQDQDKPVVVYAYVDAMSSELTSHAIENGIQDVFARPFDADIIASKINRLIKNERTLDLDLSYTRLLVPLKAEIEFNFRVVSVDENGITLKGNTFLSKGTKFHSSSSLLKQIFDDGSIQLMVTKTWLDENSEHHVFVEPNNPTELTSAALRRFILTKL
jgi:DNA-binding response OmpR family regulator